MNIGPDLPLSEPQVIAPCARALGWLLGKMPISTFHRATSASTAPKTKPRMGTMRGALLKPLVPTDRVVTADCLGEQD